MDKKQERLKIAQQHAESKGGKCLSEEYVNTDTKMLWKCFNPEHEPWLASYYNIVNKNHWCKKCAGHLEPYEYLFKAQEYAKFKGGECLSKEYINAKTKMKWKCSNSEHKFFESDYDHLVNRNRWCPECLIESYHIKDAENIIQEYAKYKNGKVVLIESKIIKTKTKITFKCHNLEHKPWTTTYHNSVELKHWCPYCAGQFSAKENIEKAKQYAISRGGYYVSGEYKNQDSKLTFKCGKPNHKPWTISYDNIVPLETWCKECRIEEQYLKQLMVAKKHAESKNGKCLSTSYSPRKKLLWQCDKGHKPWLANFHNVTGSLQQWCPECAGQLSPEKFLEKAQEHAISRGGECLSKKYIRSSNKLEWKCANNHVWKSTYPNVVLQNTWCPECRNSIFIKESYTRIILEELLGFSLKKSKPEWNINHKTNRKLELDGYNEKFQFAFEFQGDQHYKKVFPEASLENIQFRDKIKKENCEKNNVFLLIVNNIDKIRLPERMTEYLIGLLSKYKIKYNENYKIENINKKIKDLYVSKEYKKKFDKLFHKK